MSGKFTGLAPGALLGAAYWSMKARQEPCNAEGQLDGGSRVLG